MKAKVEVKRDGGIVRIFRTMPPSLDVRRPHKRDTATNRNFIQVIA